jgi:diaminopimelate epimerase
VSFVFDQRPAPIDDPSLPDFVPFTKMEGAGNDYIYVEEFDAPVKNPAPLAVKVSDRHFGIGSDGLILIGPSSKADFRMRMFNADGSEGKMCGNGVRCVAKYVYDHGLTGKTEVSLETLSGLRALHLEVKNGKVERVRVDMGAPVIVPADIPMKAPGRSFIDQPVVVAGKTWRGTAVSMGNPHLVVPVPDLNLDLPKIGPAFEFHELFPERVNTEFIQVLSRTHVRMRVWERGSGETMACGTGACAVLAACVLAGLTERRAEVELRGGSLLIEWAENNTIYMTGPAAEVCTGQFKVR